MGSGPGRLKEASKVEGITAAPGRLGRKRRNSRGPKVWFCAFHYFAIWGRSLFFIKRKKKIFKKLMKVLEGGAKLQKCKAHLLALE